MTTGPVQPGEIVADKYRIERVLGAGEIGIVFAARHLQLEQRVALKFLQPKLANDKAITARFLREAQAAARLRSEHVARVSDVETLESGQPFVVMEFLEGRDLGAILATGARLELATAVGYVLQAGEAVAEAHANGIFHRDLKPANLFLSVLEDGSMCIKILDFGIAQFGSALGDQDRPVKDADARTDIGALGVILFALLVGRAPFEAETPSVRARRDDVPAGLDEVIAKCLHKDRAEQYANMGEFARALGPFAPASVLSSVAKIERFLAGPRKPTATTGPSTAVDFARGKTSPPSSFLGAIVRVLGVPATPGIFRFAAGTCRIGSGAGCDVIVNEPTVSRVHVELTLCADGVDVQDLGSTNGTFYLGQRLARGQKLTLVFGARFQIGLVTLVVDADMDQLEQALHYSGTSYRGVLGASAPMRHLFAMLTRLEASGAPVLLQGEAGTGKEAIARALHEGSTVAKGPFVKIDCSALPRELVANELFGPSGAFERAQDGTLFLDRIGALPLDVQPTLLRAMEPGPEMRKVRLVGGTSRDLVTEVQQERFREDLFYRIASVRLRVPPLRERRTDVPALAAKFAAERGLPELPASVLEELEARGWPGNVRELRDAVRAYAALGVLSSASRDKTATLDLALRELVDPKRPYAEQKAVLLERFKSIWLDELLELTAGNQTAAAHYAEVDRDSIRQLAAKHARRSR